MLTQLRPAVSLLVAFTVLTGLLYPLAMTGIAGLVFPAQAAGSLVTRGDVTVGSALVGQAFTQDAYLKPRPSAAGDGYDASASSGTNLGPTSAKLADRTRTDADALKRETGAATIPADAVTTSGSGLDPEISPAFAALQVPRIAAARGVSAQIVAAALATATRGRTFGFLGEPRVNVLAANLALDDSAPLRDAAAPQT